MFQFCRNYKDDGRGQACVWYMVDCPVCLNENELRSKRVGVHDQVIESTNLIPSMGWGSLVPD